MKNLILILVLSIVLFINTAHAENKPYFVTGEPSLIVKVGGDPETNDSITVIAELETTLCNGYVFCYNPSLIKIGDNTGLGLDVVYKPAKRNYKDAVRLSLGAAEFKDPLKGDTTNIHVGLGFEVRMSHRIRGILAADHFMPLDDSYSEGSTTIFSAGIKYTF